MIRIPLLLAASSITLSITAAADKSGTATGMVYHDLNRNSIHDENEPGLEGISVSNGREIVKTNAVGQWQLPHDDDTIFFVIKPSGWMTPVNKHQLPQFFYIHKPAGSPKTFRYKGVDPTGPLPRSINFALHKTDEPTEFKAIFFGDPQPSNIEQVDYIKHDIIEELVGTDARFGVTLGDIMFDKLELFPQSNADIALIGIPWFNVIGNHDLNMDADRDSDSDETFHRFFGPSYYSFDYGPVHFIVLDDVDWAKRNGKRGYHGGIDEEQMAFVKNDLALVPEKKLVCLMMHIPLPKVGNRRELYRLIEKRPHTLSISGHEHWHAHKYIGAEDDWRGDKPHHHIVNVTVSGTWWKGRKDEVGIPHTTMRDGAPNGYSIITFKDTEHVLEFKAARQPATYQMNVFAPDQVKVTDTGKTQVYVNVFNGSINSTVKMRLSKSDQWITLKKVMETDPFYSATRQREISGKLSPRSHLSGPIKSDHLWKANLPEGIAPGSHLIEINATDAYGKMHLGKRIIRVTE